MSPNNRSLLTQALAAGPRAAHPLARHMAAEARGYFASDKQNLTGALTVTTGPAETLATLSGVVGGDTEVIAAAGDDRHAWAEVARWRPDDGVEETGLLGLRRNEADAVDRVIWLAVRAIDGFGSAEGDVRPPARQLFESYFDALQASQWERAGALFGSSGIWSHPPYRGGPERELCVGSDELVETLINRRGSNAIRQILTGFWQDGGQFFMEGVIEGIPGGGSFTGLGQLGSDATVRRYVAFYSGQRYV